MLPLLAAATPILFFAIFIAIVLLNVFATLAKKRQERDDRSRRGQPQQMPPAPDYSEARRQAEVQRRVDEVRRMRDLAASTGRPREGESNLDRELRRHREEARRQREQVARRGRPGAVRPQGPPAPPLPPVVVRLPAP